VATDTERLAYFVPPAEEPVDERRARDRLTEIFHELQTCHPASGRARALRAEAARLRKGR
jgi:hypothetical protein